MIYKWKATNAFKALLVLLLCFIFWNENVKSLTSILV
jgi:hypothetical protein